MSVRLKAIYKDGAFLPVTNGEKLNVPENAEVELTVPDPYDLPAKATSEEERKRELFASWDADPLRDDAPRLTRGEMHERRRYERLDLRTRSAPSVETREGATAYCRHA